MLNRLASLPTFLRLGLCVLLSTGVHAAAVLYDGIEPLAELSEDGAPVTVALLSVDDAAAFKPVVPSLTEVPDQEVKPEPKAARVVSPEQIRPVRKAVKVVKTAPQQEQKVVAETAPTIAKAPNEELVCVEPQVKETDESVQDISHVASAVTEVARVPAGPKSAAAEQTQKVIAVGGQKGSRRDLVEAVPKYRLNPKPEYPAIAAKRRWEGVVWLLVDVSAEGLVKDLQVEQTCGYGVLDRAARKSVKRWEFVPAMRAGLPVDSQVRIPIRFRLEDS